MVMACWCSCSASGASVGQEVMILGVPVALVVGFAVGEFRVSIDFGDSVGPQCAVAGRGWSWSEWRGCLWVGGIVGLLVEGAL